MHNKNYPLHRNPVFLVLIPLLMLVIVSLACGRCTSTSSTPVAYDDKASLLNDCRTLQENNQSVSLSGKLGIRDETKCVNTSDSGTVDRCELVLFVQDWGGLDIWMPIRIHNGMDLLPDLLGYNTWDLVVHGDDGERLGNGDMVRVVLKPILQTEKGMEECDFLVKTIQAATMESNGDQPMEGKVDIEFSINVTWYDTGIRVQQGQQIIISEAGGQGCNLQGSNPAWECSYFLTGVDDFMCDTNCVVNGVNYGMLIARIGDGTPMLITEDPQEFIAQTSGTLFFTVNDCQDCYGDNEGTFGLVLSLSTP